ncbi:MAG: DedA family protein [Longimicrobiales bacterium]
MEFLRDAIEFILHIDTHLQAIIADYGGWTYALLILIIFAETGLVITPFLPGDSLLFAAGTFAGLGSLNPLVLFVTLSIAAILGDTVNYWIGRAVGPRVFQKDTRFIKRKHLERTQAFYAKYGGKAIVLARFMPIVRTFAPFVAGIGSMDYKRFVFYNIFGGVLWIGLFVFGGYFFGNLPVVRDNFSLVIIVIILLSILPAVIEYLRARRSTA